MALDQTRNFRKRFKENAVTRTISLPDPESTAPYDILTSQENFRLAWERVRYHDRLDSRDWIGLKIFAANRDYNLEVLRNSLIQRTFEASFPEIKYLPKPSLTLRPMAILPIKDRVVYQALANVVAEKGRSTLSLLSNRQSFANVLCPPDHVEMFRSWRSQHQQFQRAFASLIEEGNIWLVETDIAAFYETIDHARLFDLLRRLDFVDDLTSEYLELYLPTWASVKCGQATPKGLPQGSLASDLLANVFLHELDETLATRDCHYLRYVDDIRLLARTKEAVQRGLIQVDRILKSMGLLIQTKKTVVREVADPSDEFDRMATLLSEIDRRLHDPLDSADVAQDGNMPSNPLYQINQGTENGENASLNSPLQDYLVNWFWKLKERLDTNDDDRFDEKHLRFLIWRLEPNTAIAKTLIPLLVRRPWLSELITTYIKKCELDEEATESLHDIVENHTVYDSVVALVVDTLLTKNVPLRQHHALFRKWLAENNRDWPLLSSVALALGESSDNMAVLVKAIRQQALSPSARRMALIQASRLARTKSEASEILKMGVADSSAGIIETSLYLTYIDWRMSLSELNMADRAVSEYKSIIARGYDDSLPNVYPCYIRYIFARDYNVSFVDTLDFHSLMGKEYERAADFAWQAQKSYLTNPSRYVAQLDLFHEELLFFILVDKLGWKSSKDELVRVALPDRISHLIKNKSELATFGVALQSCHQLRSSCTEAHTRLYKVLDVTNPINWRQRNELKKKLCAGYQELVSWIENGTP